LIANGSTEWVGHCFVLPEHHDHANIYYCLKNLSVAPRNKNNKKNAHKSSNNNKSFVIADKHNRHSNTASINSTLMVAQTPITSRTSPIAPM
jgi:hypothetical protein